MTSVEGMAELNALKDEDVCMLPIPCNSPAVAAALAHRRRQALHQLHTHCQGRLCGAQGCHSASTLLAEDEPQDMQVSPVSPGGHACCG